MLLYIHIEVSNINHMSENVIHYSYSIDSNRTIGRFLQMTSVYIYHLAHGIRTLCCN